MANNDFGYSPLIARMIDERRRLDERHQYYLDHVAYHPDTSYLINGLKYPAEGEIIEIRGHIFLPPGKYRIVAVYEVIPGSTLSHRDVRVDVEPVEIEDWKRANWYGGKGYDGDNFVRSIRTTPKLSEPALTSLKEYLGWK